jgi:hypothetical protein
LAEGGAVEDWVVFAGTWVEEWDTRKSVVHMTE